MGSRVVIIPGARRLRGHEKLTGSKIAKITRVSHTTSDPASHDTPHHLTLGRPPPTSTRRQLASTASRCAESCSDGGGDGTTPHLGRRKARQLGSS